MTPLLMGLYKTYFRGMTSALLAVLAASVGSFSQAGVNPSQAIAPSVNQAHKGTPGTASTAIKQFVVAQTSGLTGKLGISLDTPLLDQLPACATLEPFLPSGARLWGRVSIGVRCHSDTPWTRYVSAYISVVGVYYVASQPINAGQLVSSANAQVREGDLTTLPGSVIVDLAQLSGVVATSRIASGAPLRREWLKPLAIVQRGQTVKVLAQGNGFTVSTEGKAMTNAPAGAVIQVKTRKGDMLSGIVRSDGMVEKSP